MSAYTIIDVDTHVTESPDLWTSRAPASILTYGPRAVGTIVICQMASPIL